MGRETGGRAGTLIGLAAAFGLALTLACATVQPPSGGPVDETPPVLAAAWPESGSVGLDQVQEIRLRFSEKVDPVPASRFLFLYPPLETESTKWKRRQEVRVILAEPLPPDTTVVVEIPAGLRDVHRVPSERSFRFPIATAGELPDGELNGQLLHREEPLSQGVVELYDVPPDTLEFFEQDILRRAETDSLGRFRLAWLPVPGGPWVIRAFADVNGDHRPGENEAKRLRPGEFSLVDSVRLQDVGLTILFDPGTPGRLLGGLASLLSWSGRVLGWPMAITEEDTGWVVAPQEIAAAGQLVVQPGAEVVFAAVPPGLVRLIFFVDADGDSLLSALPAGAAAADSMAWFLEPVALIDSLTVEPGLDSSFPPPRFPATLSAWRPAAPADPDSVAVGEED